DPIRPGYTFNGWFTEAGGLGNHWDIATTTMPANDQTLFAHWTAKPYTIFFDANGVVGSMGSQSMTYGVKEALKPNTLVAPAGSRFTGWNTRADGLGDSYADKAEVLDLAAGDDSITLFAQWTENTYTIEFNPNPPEGSAVTGDMQSLKNVRYSQSIPLTANSYSCQSYVFSCWTENMDGTGTRYENRQVVEKLRGETQTGETITLFAQWAGAPYTVTYDKTLDDATGTIAPDTFTYNTWSRLPSSGFERTGSELVGWSRDKAKAQAGIAEFKRGQAVKDLPANKGDAVTLYAVWTERIAVTCPLNPTIAIDAQGNPTPDATTYFESTTTSPVAVVSAMCEPIESTPGTQSVFPDQAQWQDIIFMLRPLSGSAQNIFLKDGGVKTLNWTVPAKTEAENGKLAVSFSLKKDPLIQIAYAGDQSVPVARIAFTFSLAKA
ncbi:MAG: InlB B-repeat-containing protein, partial [Raoultibacter sp.]